MAHVEWRFPGQPSGVEDDFLFGVNDLELRVSGGNLTAYTVTRTGGEGLAEWRLMPDGRFARVADATLPASSQTEQPALIFLGPDQDVIGVAGTSAEGILEFAADGLTQYTHGNFNTGAFSSGLSVVHAMDIGGQTWVAGAQANSNIIQLCMLNPDSACLSQSAMSFQVSAPEFAVRSMDSVSIGANAYLVMAGGGSTLLSSYRLDGTQALMADTLSVDSGLGAAGATELRTAQLTDGAYAVLAAADSGSLSVFRIEADGDLVVTDHVMDTPMTRFANARHLDIATLDDRTYVAAAGSDDGLSLFELLPGGQLLHLLSVEDTTTLALSDVTAMQLEVMNGDIQIVLTNGDGRGLTRLVADIDAGGVVEVGTAGQSNLSGTTGADLLVGGARNETIEGHGGRDILRDGAGVDDLWGGAGADVFILDRDGQVDRIRDFEPGVDQIDLSHWAFLRSGQQLAVVSRANGAEIRFGEETLDIITASGTPITLDQIQSMTLLNQDRLLPVWIEEALAGDPEPVPLVLFGTAGNDILQGQATDDDLKGSAGDDTLLGGAGADILNGGPGSDVIHVDDPGDTVQESRRWAGEDHVYASTDFWMRVAHVENLTLMGADDIRGVGNGLQNEIIGNAGNNIIDGGRNNDRMIGGDGNDTYFLRAPNDTIIEHENGGIDAVRAYRSAVVPDNVERLYLQATFDFNAIGNSQNNLLVGNNADNRIIGREGRDTLRGQGGSDTFVFDRSPGPNNVDRIVDFATGEDELWIKASLFGLPRGEVTDTMFHLGRQATSPDHRVLFDPDTGGLRLDRDGAGGENALLSFVLDGGAALDPSDILLF